MVDGTDNLTEEQRPRLKKIKRPVRRMEGAEQGYVPPKAAPEQERFNAPTKTINNEFDLDSYLDGEEEDGGKVSKRFITDEDLYVEKRNLFKVGNLYTLNLVILVSVAVFIIGMITSKIVFSGNKVVQDGLQGVVINPEVPRGRVRCGVAERTQGCVLYIMNPQKQELNARDFYDLAAQLTGRQKFVIETGNIRYSNIKIKPGAIAQFNIPPLVN